MRFVPNIPFETVDAVVEVDAGLPVGSHRFQLVVEGQSGLKSSPTEFIVVVARTGERPPSPFSPELVTPAPIRPKSVRPVSIRSSDPSTVTRQPKRRPAEPKPAKRKPPRPKPAKPKPPKPTPPKRGRKPRTTPP